MSVDRIGEIMEVIYSEIYGKDLENNGYCLPTIQFNYEYEERELLPKSKYNIIENEEDTNLYTAYIPFFNTFFDGLREETVIKLQSIFDFAKTINHSDYVNKEIWNLFLFTSNISVKNITKIVNTHLKNIENPKAKKPLYRKYNSKSEEQLEVERYYRNKVNKYNKEIGNKQNKIYKELLNPLYNSKKLTIKSQYIIKNAREKDLPIISIMKQGIYGGIMNIDYKFEFKDELDLLYTLLDCIFQSEYNYKIKKCECNNFYITLDTKTKHCPCCLSNIRKMQKKKYEDNEIVRIERRVNQLFYTKKRLPEKANYLKTKQSKKEQLVNKEITELEYKNWLLSQYRNKKY